MQNVSAKDLAFQTEVLEFLRTVAPVGSGVAIWQETAWTDALSEKGWLAPAWPKHLGGGGFSETQKYTWYRACHARIERFVEPPGIGVVGPLLGQIAPRNIWQRFLPPILALQEQWCVALQTQDAPRLSRPEGRWQLNGQAAWVAQAQNSDFVLGLAQNSMPDSGWDLFICPMNVTGLSLQAVETLAGEVLHHLEFDGVEIEKQGVVLPLEDLTALQLPSYQLGLSGMVAAQLEQLDVQLATLSEDEDLLYRRQEAAIELAALEALELRYVDALERRHEVPFSLSVLALRGAAVDAKVGALLMDSFGYYALPYPDMWLQHNTGAVGPEGARNATAAWLERAVSENYASVSQDFYGKLAAEQQDTGER